jgi:4'-phosphopantetheinyl transferase
VSPESPSLTAIPSGVSRGWPRWAERTPWADELHVVVLDLDVPAPALARVAALLSSDERDRAARFAFERDRRRFVAARGGLRSILGACLAGDPARITFAYGRHGKPVLAGAFADTGVCFNVSHSDALGLVALTRGREIGVDVECVRPLRDAAAIARRFFSPRETASLLSLPEDQRERAFFDCWTRKEAFIKATGEGLSRALDAFDVSLRPGEPARLEHVEGDPGEADHWSLLSLAPASGYASAVALRGQIEDVTCGLWAAADDGWADAIPPSYRQRTLEAR